MLRNPNLIPLSHQHQHALALCVRLERAPKSGPDEVANWNREIDQMFQAEIRFHFDAEERLLFPEAKNFPALTALVDELLREHGVLRSFFTRAADGALDSATLAEFAALLSRHVRKEERQLFEDCQRLMTPEHMAHIGARIDEYFKTMPGASCGLR